MFQRNRESAFSERNSNVGHFYLSKNYTIVHYMGR